MTKNELIFQVLLAISGGEYTEDISVRYGEAEVALAAAVNYVQLGNYWLENKAEREKVVNPMVLVPFDNIPILFSTVRQRHYITLPARVIPLPKGRSLSITTEYGDTFIPMSQGDDALFSHYEDFTDQVFFLSEGTTTVWLYGMENKPLLKYCRPKYPVNVLDLPGTAEILLPANGDNDVMTLMKGWLTGERAMPKQYTEDGLDKVKMQ